MFGFGTSAEQNAYQLGQLYGGGITPSGPSRAGWYSPQQVAKIELSYKKNTAGVVAQREALLVALAQLDPHHPLLDAEHRGAIYDEAYDTYQEKK